MTCAPNAWVIAGQLATPIVVAGIAAYFAWQQATTAKKKLRLDHFDKRFVVFNAARTFLGRVLALGECKVEDQEAFVSAKLGAPFLFSDPAINSFLDEVLKRAIDLPFLQRELESAQSDDERELAKKKYLAERNWLRDQAQTLETKFRPHLQLQD